MTPSPLAVGYAASVVTVMAFLPQAIKAWRSRSVRDISYGMIALLLASAAIWIVYGVMTADVPVVITNMGTAILNLAILAAKFRFRQQA